MFRNVARSIHWILSEQLGLNLIKLAHAPSGLAKYIFDLARYSLRGDHLAMSLKPCIHDWRQNAGAIDSEYFWQDLFVARLVYENNPVKHVDVGSRLDGFVSHLAAFREVEIIDVRPLDYNIPGTRFRQADLMTGGGLPDTYCDSISCLHAIEHFGLGRYGDPLNPSGLKDGLNNLSRILTSGGRLYLSCPVGDDRVYFNAHRAMRPQTVAKLAGEAGLTFSLGWLFNLNTKSFEPFDDPENNSDLNENHSLSVFVFTKLN
jgi:hypothetical protein